MKRFSKSLLKSLSLLGISFCFTAEASASVVHVSRHPGSNLEKIAASLNADLIKDSQLHNEKPRIFTASVHLSEAKTPALFVQIQSGRLCGASGCSTSVYILKNGKWNNILDDVNGEISVLPERHKGMANLLVDGTDKWIWDGNRYIEQSAGANAS
ncbi:hypothetical protein FAI40_09030 [Acetobacteraceae bacterium]|nr:hypothetical protein FAI40_09030 [Acetobacteraceae bacterium]